MLELPDDLSSRLVTGSLGEAARGLKEAPGSGTGADEVDVDFGRGVESRRGRGRWVQPLRIRVVVPSHRKKNAASCRSVPASFVMAVEGGPRGGPRAGIRLR